MRVQSIQLVEFKRFTDLTIEGLSEDHQLVVLLGPNGSGKSSLFEAFNTCLASINQAHWFDRTYHMKVKSGEDTSKFNQQRYQQEQQQWQEVMQRIKVRFFGHQPPNWANVSGWEKSAFYLRGASRTSPEHRSDQITPRQHLNQQAYQPANFSYVDSQVQQNYQELIHRSLKAISNPSQKTALQVGEEGTSLFRKLQESVRRVFPDLLLEGMGDPTDAGTFVFKKSESGIWRFKNLSSGEKSAFDLLLDFHVKRELLASTIFCIDEPELHMHTELQARLLGEIVEQLPLGWQLWLATHSAGMVRTAQNWGERNNGRATFLDFAGRDFDKPLVIKPEPPSRTLWKKTFAIALGDFAELLLPREIVFCEGSASRTGQFDAKCLQRIFSGGRPDVEFVSLGSATEVENNSIILSTVIGTLAPGVTIRKVIDRDDRSETEVADAIARGVRVLSCRQIESFLFDQEILDKLCVASGQPEKIAEVAGARSEAMANLTQRGKPVDDTKSASGEIYVQIKKILSLTRCGNTREAFAIDTLAPLITPETQAYKALETDIFSSAV